MGLINTQNLIFEVNQTPRDIPTPISPEYVQKIYECGKIDLIDRSSVKYNSSALVDGSLDECDN